MSADKSYLSYYKTQVQERFLPGVDVGKLRQREFEYLAEQIEQTSGIKLSLSTLKRVWRDEPVQLPHPSTLNALVSILGYRTWGDFKKANSEVPLAQVPAPAGEMFTSPNTARKLRRPFLWIGAAMITLVAGLFVLESFNARSSKKLSLPENIPFQADKTVTVGVPNTVEFTYDVRSVEADSFFIQQSWDPRNKMAIDPSKHYLSTIYYLPGFHRAKLIVNDSIVAKARIHIKTSGWMPVIEYKDGSHKPFYLDPTGCIQDGVLHATETFIRNSGIDPSNSYQLRYYNIRDFGNLMSDDFTLDAQLKMDKTKNITCPFSQIVIVTEENIFFLQLTDRGCVGEISLLFGEHYQSARDNDLSVFGRDLYEWQRLRIESSNKSVTIFLNDSTAHQLTYKQDFGKVVGVVFSFNSPAAVRDFTIEQGNDLR